MKQCIRRAYPDATVACSALTGPADFDCARPFKMLNGSITTRRAAATSKSFGVAKKARRVAQWQSAAVTWQRRGFESFRAYQGRITVSDPIIVEAIRV